MNLSHQNHTCDLEVDTSLEYPKTSSPFPGFEEHSFSPEEEKVEKELTMDSPHKHKYSPLSHRAAS